LRKAGALDEIVLLPLYPQYSYATTLSSLKEWRRVVERTRNGAKTTRPSERTIDHFCEHPLYIQALVERIGSVLRQFRQLAHSSRLQRAWAAMSLVEKGDPYPKQIEETVRLVCELGARRYPGWPKIHLLCYQSRSGRISGWNRLFRRR